MVNHHLISDIEYPGEFNRGRVIIRIPTIGLQGGVSSINNVMIHFY